MNVTQTSAEAAMRCGLHSECETISGALRVYAESAPESDISASLTVIAPSAGGGIIPGSVTLPIASASSLGVVKVGNGLDIQEDGTLSIDLADNDDNGIPDLFDDSIATDEEVGEMLNEVYGGNATDITP